MDSSFYVFTEGFSYLVFDKENIYTNIYWSTTKII